MQKKSKKNDLPEQVGPKNPEGHSHSQFSFKTPYSHELSHLLKEVVIVRHESVHSIYPCKYMHKNIVKLYLQLRQKWMFLMIQMFLHWIQILSNHKLLNGSNLLQ